MLLRNYYPMLFTRITPLIPALMFSVALASCKGKAAWSDLPGATNLEELKQTEFVPTLDNPLPQQKNIIYASAFLYAWEKVEDVLQQPVLSGQTNSLDFKLLTQSSAHENSLSEGEYTASAEMEDGAIVAQAFFNKTLPFEAKLQLLDPITFGSTKVAAFGMDHYDETLIPVSQVLYYKDDRHFILKLSPEVKAHEIILVKGLDQYTTLKEGVTSTYSLIRKGKSEMTDPKQAWKYRFAAEDVFAIPVIKFNIATRYKKLEGQRFNTKDHKDHVLEMAYQRTGFILNENGAVVESEVTLTTDSASGPPIAIHPKKMVFDKEFLVIVKRIDQTNPYFVMRVNNPELLTAR